MVSGGPSSGGSHPFQDALDNEANKGDAGCQPPTQKERGMPFDRFNQRSFHLAIRFSKNELIPSLASSVLQSLAKASFM